jgi:hypothetical protein
VELDEVANTRLLQRAQACVDVALRQVRVDRDMRDLAAVRKQALDDEERRDGVTEPGLERPSRAFPADPLAQRGSLFGPDRHGCHIVKTLTLAYLPQPLGRLHSEKR